MRTPEESKYGEDYLRWKDWGDRSFGRIEAFERAYFDAEIVRAGVPASPLAVLEIGFGNGSFLAYGKEMTWDISGTEVNEELVRVAKAHGYDAFCAKDLRGFDSDRFDLIVALDVLEHIEQGALPSFLIDVRRTLKPQGLFVARFPNGDSPFGLANQHGDITHITTIGSAKAAYLCKAAGLEELRIGGEAQPIFCHSLPHAVHRLLTWPLKSVLEVLVHYVFFPRQNVTFFAKNLVVVFRKPRSS